MVSGRGLQHKENNFSTNGVSQIFSFFCYLLHFIPCLNIDFLCGTSTILDSVNCINVTFYKISEFATTVCSVIFSFYFFDEKEVYQLPNKCEVEADW